MFCTFGNLLQWCFSIKNWINFYEALRKLKTVSNQNFGSFIVIVCTFATLYLFEEKFVGLRLKLFEQKMLKLATNLEQKTSEKLFSYFFLHLMNISFIDCWNSKKSNWHLYSIYLAQILHEFLYKQNYWLAKSISRY